MDALELGLLLTLYEKFFYRRLAACVSAERDNHYNGYTLRELARASLVERGVSGIPDNSLGIVGMAFTHSTSDFGVILAGVANKSLLKG